jgi:putative radical SAM enzyme (TIGR03279 family)
MTVRIERVDGTSGFFKPGDEIISIDARPVRDQLDVLFLTAGEKHVRFTIRRGPRSLSREVTAEGLSRARLALEGMRFLRCGSACIFCFMDQMPPGLRRSLYEKDDDYRLSFLFGNFVTLNDVRERDLERIIRLHLSPLYVSVHAARRRVRERIFGRPLRRDIMEDLSRLAKAGIVLHAQIVLVPGVNDRSVLRDTVRRLFSLHPACRTVAIVPVGLTAHRDELPPLRRLTPTEARTLIDWAEIERRRLARITGGEPFVHLADEFYLMANRTLPTAESYGDYPQLSNGVGLCRHFLEALEADLERLRRRPARRVSLTLATGTLGARFMRRYALPAVAQRAAGVSIRVLPVRNRLFGPQVGVSGLLSGGDIIRAARRAGPLRGCLVIPPNAVNHEGLFLDGLRTRDVERALAVPVIAARSTFLENAVTRRCARRSST